MIKICSPGEAINLMAFLAIRSETGEGVTGLLCILIVSAVTAIARDRCAGVFVISSIRMTIFALQGGVLAKEGKSRVLMSLDHVTYFPRLY
jgi:hypothetical protein